ncbi:hypothetical protein METHB2_680012 [Candidatus Methylobacter favarea]|uniref:Uncharacterized protein n=1 Tax=Candidatus Methylobacter favarea TaxID=2707345 RepID=A0A8S0XKX8_9GAMM|nr:hypothetical protein METHB2_680012 [Candidatus Methylobacter favarea]
MTEENSVVRIADPFSEKFFKLRGGAAPI